MNYDSSASFDKWEGMRLYFNLVSAQDWRVSVKHTDCAAIIAEPVDQERRHLIFPFANLELSSKEQEKRNRTKLVIGLPS